MLLLLFCTIILFHCKSLGIWENILVRTVRFFFYYYYYFQKQSVSCNYHFKALCFFYWLILFVHFWGVREKNDATVTLKLKCFLPWAQITHEWNEAFYEESQWSLKSLRKSSLCKSLNGLGVTTAKIVSNTLFDFLFTNRIISTKKGDGFLLEKRPDFQCQDSHSERKKSCGDLSLENSCLMTVSFLLKRIYNRCKAELVATTLKRQNNGRLLVKDISPQLLKSLHFHLTWLWWLFMSLRADINRHSLGD